MSSRLALVIAIILGVVAALAVNAWVDSESQSIKQSFAPRLIVVAKKPIPEGTVITKSLIQSQNSPFKYSEIPEKYVVAGMITKNDLQQRFLDYVTLERIEVERPIFQEKLGQPFEKQVQNQIVASGKRAITIPVDQVGAVAGLLRVGDMVDAVGTFDLATANGSTPPPTAAPAPAPLGSAGLGSAPKAGAAPTMVAPLGPAAGAAAVRPKTSQGRKTLYLLQAARIIALDDRSDLTGQSRAKRNYHTLTLEVTPYDALRLLNALEQGKVTFLLRNPADKEIQPQEVKGAVVVWDILSEFTTVVPHIFTPKPAPKAPAEDGGK